MYLRMPSPTPKFSQLTMDFKALYNKSNTKCEPSNHKDNIKTIKIVMILLTILLICWNFQKCIIWGVFNQNICLEIICNLSSEHSCHNCIILELKSTRRICYYSCLHLFETCSRVSINISIATIEIHKLGKWSTNNLSFLDLENIYHLSIHIRDVCIYAHMNDTHIIILQCFIACENLLQKDFKHKEKSLL
jgi:hypothetical protein